MGRSILSRINKIVFLAILSGLLFLTGSKPVSATGDNSGKCKVVFADSRGVVSGDTYRKWGKTVDKGSYITLPKVKRSGYKCVWIEKNGKKEVKYATGRKVRVTRNMKFCLRTYKLYTVRYYNMNGKKEYTSLRDRGYEGENLVIPEYPDAAGYRILGWGTSAGGKVTKKEGQTVHVTKDMKFYLIAKKDSKVRLCTADGSVWKTIDTSSGSARFPAVYLKSGNMCLGWSRSRGKTSEAEYKTGDRIPASGNYYIVVFKKSQDRAPSSVRTPVKYKRVYFVGDSRTVFLRNTLGSSKPSNVDFVCSSGKGLEWFKEEGCPDLIHKLSEQPVNSRKAVVVNFGVNDLQNINGYVSYMKALAKKLKRDYNCDMYYMSVNPVNSAVIRANNGRVREEAQITAFNRTIYQKLCDGDKRSFTYINTCTYLQNSGWISNRFNTGINDGIHYSEATTLRIYDYCITKLNH